MPAYIQLQPLNWRGSTMAIHTAVCPTTMVDYEAKQVNAGQSVECFNRSRRTEVAAGMREHGVHERQHVLSDTASHSGKAIVEYGR